MGATFPFQTFRNILFENTASWDVIGYCLYQGIDSKISLLILSEFKQIDCFLKGIRKTFWGTTKKCENKNLS